MKRLSKMAMELDVPNILSADEMQLLGRLDSIKNRYEAAISSMMHDCKRAGSFMASARKHRTRAISLQKNMSEILLEIAKAAGKVQIRNSRASVAQRKARANRAKEKLDASMGADHRFDVDRAE